MQQFGTNLINEPHEKSIRHGGRILADQLAIQGCEAVYCVAGESFLPALDGLYDHPEIKTIPCRQEGGAAIMAEAHGKMTGRPAVCFVTRGPGATNASIGVHIAHQASTPMVLMIGQVQRNFIDREAFQEVDYRAMFQPLAKWVAQVESVERIPEYVARAWRTAMSGRSGPVVLAFPEDVLYDEASVEDLDYVEVSEVVASEDVRNQVVKFFHDASRPVVIVGGTPWSEKTCRQITEFADRNNLPVIVEFRCQDYMDNRHPNYIGDLGISTSKGLEEIVLNCDRLLCIGARLGELPTQRYSLIKAPIPAPEFFHVHTDISELGRVYQPQVAVNASPVSFVDKIADLELENSSSWLKWTQQARATFVSHSTCQLADSSILTNEQAIVWLRENLPHDAILTSGAGINTGVLHQYYYYGAKYRTQLAPIAGSMGYGLPAAIAAKICEPSREVVCVVGDGDFMMTSQELATATLLKLKILIIVVNNFVLGTIRKYQENHYPGRVVATDLENPDFATYARSFGAFGKSVRTFDEFVSAMRRARNFEGISLIDLQIDRKNYLQSLTC